MLELKITQKKTIPKADQGKNTHHRKRQLIRIESLETSKSI